MTTKNLFAAAALLLLAHSANAVPFTASCTDCPLAIGPSPSTTSSFLNVATTGTIADLDVFVEIQHTFDGDLDIFLIHQDTNTTVQLFAQSGGSGDNIFALFNDEGVGPIDSFTPDYSTPCGTDPGCSADTGGTGILLSAFDGEDISGTWELQIVDNLFGDAGTLLNWEIRADIGAVVPEPGIVFLMGLGLAGLAFARRRR